jgi:SAM-dependent methyltransferase
MAAWSEGDYGAHIAGVYNTVVFGAATDTADVCDFISSLAAEIDAKTVLEVGSGTGRLLIPMAARGLEVEGLEISPEMVAQMRANEGGERIPVTIGDMTDFDLGRQVDIIFSAHNSFQHLTTQERQVQALKNQVRHLAPGGRLVLEAWLPYPMTRLPPKGVTTLATSADEVVIYPYRHDQVGQMIEGSVLAIRKDGVEIYPAKHRYVWPPELDLMAELAGLRLLERWSDWARSPFGESSDNHVCVFAHRD